MKTFQGHNRLDRRSLAVSRLTARKIESDPQREGLKKALANIRRWRASGTDCALWDEWVKILQQDDWKLVRHFLCAEGEKETQLRQASPFVSMLSEDTRIKIFLKYQEEKRKKKDNDFFKLIEESLHAEKRL